MCIYACTYSAFVLRSLTMAHLKLHLPTHTHIASARIHPTACTDTGTHIEFPLSLSLSHLPSLLTFLPYHHRGTGNLGQTIRAACMSQSVSQYTQKTLARTHAHTLPQKYTNIRLPISFPRSPSTQTCTQKYFCRCPSPTYQASSFTPSPYQRARRARSDPHGCVFFAVCTIAFRRRR